MRNILRAMNYQIRRDNFTYYALLLGVGLTVLTFCTTPQILDRTAVQYIAGGDLLNVLTILPMVIVLFVTRICGWDFADKTINYEVLSGHDRRSIYFGRAIPALLWGITATYGTLIIPIVFFAAKNGWGAGCEPSALILRLALMIFPLFRTACELVLITVLLRSFISAAVAGYLLIMLPTIGSALYEEAATKASFKLTWQLSASNLMKLCSFNSRMGFENGVDITLYDGSLSAGMICGTVLCSLIIGFGALFLGAHLFRKSDMA